MSLDVSERTLRNWKRFSKDGEFPKIGRPKLTSDKRTLFKSKIKEEWILQGKPGWRCVKYTLKNYPTRLIQEP